ncbi:MAG TPA: hypothetical protein VK436_13660 [Methanocella sp.]|nr:hypothetical protein [Methanocella sp.]
MSSDAIGTAVMVMTTVIITIALVNAIFPNLISSLTTIRATGDEVGDRAATSLEFINYEKVSPSIVRFDVLNIGRGSIPGSEMAHAVVYLGAENAPLTIITYNTSTTETYWNYTITGTDDDWDSGETMVITLADPQGNFASGDYRLRLQVSNGGMSESSFTV